MHLFLCVRCCVVSNLTFTTEGSICFVLLKISLYPLNVIFGRSSFVPGTLDRPDSDSMTHGGVIGLRVDVKSPEELADMSAEHSAVPL